MSAATSRRCAVRRGRTRDRICRLRRIRARRTLGSRQEMLTRTVALLSPPRASCLRLPLFGQPSAGGSPRRRPPRRTRDRRLEVALWLWLLGSLAHLARLLPLSKRSYHAFSAGCYRTQPKLNDENGGLCGVCEDRSEAIGVARGWELAVRQIPMRQPTAETVATRG